MSEENSLEAIFAIEAKNMVEFEAALSEIIDVDHIAQSLISGDWKNLIINKLMFYDKI